MYGKKMKKEVVRISLVVVVIGLLMGIVVSCASERKDNIEKKEENVVQNEEAVTIKIGLEAGGVVEFYKEIVDEFIKQTNIKVEFVDIPGQNLHDRFVTAAVAHTGEFDVLDIDGPWIPEFATKGFLIPLNTMLNENDRKDFFPSALETASYDGKLYMLPFLTQSTIIYYRTDLFEKAGIKIPPITPEEYRLYAKKLTDVNNGIWGTIVEGQQFAEPVTQFTDFVFQFGGKLLEKNDDKFTVCVNSPEVIEAFNYMLGIQYEDKSSPPGAVNYNNTDVANLFLEGKVAMVKNWPYMYKMAKDPKQSKVVGKFSVAVPPKTSAIWSWGFGISPDSKQKEAAYKFIEWSVSSDVLTRFAKQTINPVPRKSVLEAVLNDKMLSEEDRHALSVMIKAVEQGTAPLLCENYAAFRDRLAVSLSKIMTRQATPEEELQSALPELQSIVNKK